MGGHPITKALVGKWKEVIEYYKYISILNVYVYTYLPVDMRKRSTRQLLRR